VVFSHEASIPLDAIRLDEIPAVVRRFPDTRHRALLGGLGLALLRLTGRLFRAEPSIEE
jgi:hypothetical protein